MTGLISLVSELIAGLESIKCVAEFISHAGKTLFRGYLDHGIVCLLLACRHGSSDMEVENKR